MDRLARANTSSQPFDMSHLSKSDYSISLCLMLLSMFDRRVNSLKVIELRLKLLLNVNRLCKHIWNLVGHYVRVM